MKYRYSIESGRTTITTNAKKYIVGAVLSVALVGGFAAPALAAKPANPGCFGQDRAAVLQGMQDGTSPYSTSAGGASEWGVLAAERAAENGQMNRDYMAYCEAL